MPRSPADTLLRLTTAGSYVKMIVAAPMPSTSSVFIIIDTVSHELLVVDPIDTVEPGVAPTGIAIQSIATTRKPVSNMLVCLIFHYSYYSS